MSRAENTREVEVEARLIDDCMYYMRAEGEELAEYAIPIAWRA